MMRIKVQIPGRVLIDEPAQKIIAEAGDGFFCIEPRHIDFVAALVPGLVTYVGEDGSENILASDEGILVKCGREVLISALNAIPGKGLAELHDEVTKFFTAKNEEESAARSALVRLETGIVRRFIELEKLP